MNSNWQEELHSVANWSVATDFKGLIAGNYIVKVRDSKGCEDQVAVNLVIPTVITATITVNKTTLSLFW